MITKKLDPEFEGSSLTLETTVDKNHGDSGGGSAASVVVVAVRAGAGVVVVQ